MDIGTLVGLLCIYSFRKYYFSQHYKKNLSYRLKMLQNMGTMKNGISIRIPLYPKYLYYEGGLQ
jgi:hypothetical protein